MKGQDYMNIFEQKESFLGCMDRSITEDSLLSIFRLAKQIKLRLGKKGYLLDNYLSLVFEGLTTEVSYGAADEGFQVGGNSQHYFFALLDDSVIKNHHPMEERMREVYAQKANTIVYQERYTKLCMLLFSMADELLIQAVKEFTSKLDSNLNSAVDEIRVKELYTEISRLAGEAMLDELNTKIQQRFMIAPLALVFAQGMTDDMLYRLIARDYETSKQMFQLLLDSIPDTV